MSSLAYSKGWATVLIASLMARLDKFNSSFDIFGLGYYNFYRF